MLTIENLAWMLGTMLIVSVAVTIALVVANKSLVSQVSDRYSDVIKAEASAKASDAHARAADTAVDLADTAIRERDKMMEAAHGSQITGTIAAQAFGRALGRHTGFTYDRAAEIIDAAMYEVEGFDNAGVSVGIRGIVWASLVQGRSDRHRMEKNLKAQGTLKTTTAPVALAPVRKKGGK